MDATSQSYQIHKSIIQEAIANLSLTLNVLAGCSPLQVRRRFYNRSKSTITNAKAIAVYASYHLQHPLLPMRLRLRHPQLFTTPDAQNSHRPAESRDSDTSSNFPRAKRVREECEDADVGMTKKRRTDGTKEIPDMMPPPSDCKPLPRSPRQLALARRPDHRSPYARAALQTEARKWRMVLTQYLRMLEKDAPPTGVKGNDAPWKEVKWDVEDSQQPVIWEFETKACDKEQFCRESVPLNDKS